MAEFSKFNGYTVKDAIARNIAKGRNQALAYSDYATMVETLNAMDNEQFKIGQNIYIGTVGVPDLWVYSIEPVLHDYNHVSDEAIVELLKNNGTIQVGYYKLAMLEGQKVDLTPVNEQLADHTNAIAANTNAIAANTNAISEQNKNIQNKADNSDVESIEKTVLSLIRKKILEPNASFTNSTKFTSSFNISDYKKYGILAKLNGSQNYIYYELYTEDIMKDCYTSIKGAGNIEILASRNASNKLVLCTTSNSINMILAKVYGYA